MLQKYNASTFVSLFLLFAPNIWNSTDRHEALFFLEAIPDNGSPFKVAIGKKKMTQNHLTKQPNNITWHGLKTVTWKGFYGYAVIQY